MSAYERGFRDGLEAAAKACERRAETRFADYGITEPDTGAQYYSLRDDDTYTVRDEEDDDCAAAIRSLSVPAGKTLTDEQVREIARIEYQTWASSDKDLRMACDRIANAIRAALKEAEDA